MRARRSGKIVSPPIERRIFLIRAQRVMLDDDLAELYDVPVKVLNQAVKRNLSRFPVTSCSDSQLMKRKL